MGKTDQKRRTVLAAVFIAGFAILMRRLWFLHGGVEKTLPSERVTKVFQIFGDGGQDAYFGEDVSQLEHALQAAHTASQSPGASPHLVAAALLHDIGHLLKGESIEKMGDLGVRDHERVGADFLKELGFPDGVTELIRGHVDAKRYLCSVDSSYYSRLSEASKGTLEKQGGPMNSQEVEAFRKNSSYQLKLEVRQCDELAKVKDLKVPVLESYRGLLEGILGV